MHFYKGGARLFLATSVCALVASAQAAETITYVYDQFGRLTKVVRANSSGSPSVETAYRYDDADNREGVTVSGPGGVDPVPAPPAFSISSASADEGGKLVFTVSRSNASPGTFAVSYATSNGSAAAPDDYAAASGTLTFTDSASQTISIATVADGAQELDEAMLVTLSGPTNGATISTAQATGTIKQSAGPPNRPPVTNGDSITVNMNETVQLDVITNDSDPDGDQLTLIEVSHPGGWARVGPGNHVEWAGAPEGHYTVHYVIRDEHGATASGILDITSENPCSNKICLPIEGAK